MNSNKQFNSQIKLHNPFALNIHDEEIKNEVMFFNSDLDFAYSIGGEITRSFLDALPSEWFNAPLVIDTRVHMLMPGWYPAIPGYHHDDVPRPEIPVGQHFITAGQPDYDNPRYRAEHIMGLVNANVCPTHFAIGECEMPKVEWGDLIYRKWDAEVKSLIKNKQMQLVKSPDRQLIEFDCETFHTGEKAVSNGWRWFGRVSRNTDRTKKITNEIRRQAQVYLEFPMDGW